MIGFDHPLLLWALLLLLFVIWLLRILPPAPRRMVFPPLFLLAQMRLSARPPAHPPWLLWLLRSLLCAALILALAGPIWHKPGLETAPPGAPAPLLLVIDNSWSSAGDWTARLALARRFCDEAIAGKRPILWLATAEPNPAASAALPADLAWAQIKSIAPRPWPNDAGKLSTAIAATLLAQPALPLVWMPAPLLSQDDRDLIAGLATHAHVEELAAANPDIVWFAAAPESSDSFAVMLRRSTAGAQEDLHVRGFDSNGALLLDAPVEMNAGQTATSARLEIDLTARNHIARLDIGGQNQAGAVLLLDAGARRPDVGILGQANAGPVAAAPLLDEKFYLAHALEDFAAARVGSVTALLATPPALMIWPGEEILTAGEQDKLAAWVRKGGTLLRFAGGNLAGDNTALLPAPIIDGQRFARPDKKAVPLGPWPQGSPFAALAVPADLTVVQGALTSPVMDKDAALWAVLEDGAPFVSAKKMGAGSVIFVHVPAAPLWSSLPLAGFFLDLLHKAVALAGEGGQGAGGHFDTEAGAPKPVSLATMLDGFGALVTVPPDLRAPPILPAELRAAIPGALHPPGLYGNGQQMFAYNLGPALNAQNLAGAAELNLPAFPLPKHAEAQNLAGFFYALAFLLLLSEWLLTLFYQGYLALPMRRALPFVALAALLLAGPAHAADSSAVWIGMIGSGNAAMDAETLSGLSNLREIALARANFSDIEVERADPEGKALPLYAFLYWRIQGQNNLQLSERALGHLRDYMSHGGLLVIDFADGGQHGGDVLRRLLAENLALPPLVKADAASTISRSYYLLAGFPGRYSNRPLWIEANPSPEHDQTASIIVGDSDWAGAWADASHAAGMSGDAEPAIKFGINLLMYALTGNYKSDQLHIKALLDRMEREQGYRPSAPGTGAPATGAPGAGAP